MQRSAASRHAAPAHQQPLRMASTAMEMPKPACVARGWERGRRRLATGSAHWRRRRRPRGLPMRACRNTRAVASAAVLMLVSPICAARSAQPTPRTVSRGGGGEGGGGEWRLVRGGWCGGGAGGGGSTGAVGVSAHAQSCRAAPAGAASGARGRRQACAHGCVSLRARLNPAAAFPRGPHVRRSGPAAGTGESRSGPCWRPQQE